MMNAKQKVISKAKAMGLTPAQKAKVIKVSKGTLKFLNSLHKGLKYVVAQHQQRNIRQQEYRELEDLAWKVMRLLDGEAKKKAEDIMRELGKIDGSYARQGLDNRHAQTALRMTNELISYLRKELT